jgi:hypothetical protein
MLPITGEGNLRPWLSSIPITKLTIGHALPKWSATRRVVSLIFMAKSCEICSSGIYPIDRDQRRFETSTRDSIRRLCSTKVQSCKTRLNVSRWLALVPPKSKTGIRNYFNLS